MTSPRAIIAVVAGGALLPALLGCGSSSAGASPQADAAVDGTAADAAADAIVEAGDAVATGVGVLTFSEQVDGGGTFFAGFSQTLPVLDPSCTVVDAGSCQTTSCGPATATDAGFVPAPNAGTLTLTGGVFGAAGAPVGVDTAGTYFYASPGALFAPGDTLGVSATGGVIPPFTQQTVIAPPTVVLTGPASDGGLWTVATSQPLTVSWTGGQAGALMVLTATALFTTGGVASATCTWDAALGTGAVPSAALKPLAAENAQTSGFTWFQQTSRGFTAGPVAVTLSAFVTQASLAAFQ